MGESCAPSECATFLSWGNGCCSLSGHSGTTQADFLPLSASFVFLTRPMSNFAARQDGPTTILKGWLVPPCHCGPTRVVIVQWRCEGHRGRSVPAGVLSHLAVCVCLAHLATSAAPRNTPQPPPDRISAKVWDGYMRNPRLGYYSSWENG